MRLRDAEDDSVIVKDIDKDVEDDFESDVDADTDNVRFIDGEKDAVCSGVLVRVRVRVGGSVRVRVPLRDSDNVRLDVKELVCVTSVLFVGDAVSEGVSSCVRVGGGL